MGLQWNQFMTKLVETNPTLAELQTLVTAKGVIFMKAGILNLHYIFTVPTANDQQFLVIDGLYLVNWDTEIPNASILQSDETSEHSSTIQDLLISNKGLFTADGMAVPTPFVKLN